ncbi:Hypothetical protein DEACI_3721 [Acididesulfobacillus acetoxydans]|uniref:Uncharacterized protein n=1 Tax=Acididesulfobacillus acetoxydans TaxID=1561005 RepID=A0A8S0W581_9FIRM|nr:hypothetical protein [Acididesulfobacillus acetoxydans]CAA7602898.1 Hypothetical protein DEACI_3721 [Acididesulfobacillus acetoxydans]CEJ05779.1 Hypothetical protein DEACI_0199 [Acididesulfobacillus acetoxydans]
MKWLDILYRLTGQVGGRRARMKSMGKIKDSIALGLLAGLIGTLTMDTSNWILWRRRKTESLLGHLAGSMLVGKWRTNRRKNFLLGQIAHMFTGSALGVPLVYLFKRTGRDVAYVKGAFYGSLTWSVLVDGATRLGLYRAKPRLTKTFYAALFDNMLYGLSATFAILNLADRSLLPEKRQTQNLRTESRDFDEYFDDMTPEVIPEDTVPGDAPSYVQ